MSQSSNFCSDPKVIISIIALAFSGVNLIWTLSNQRGQNRKWDKLNEGNPEICEIRLRNYKEFTREQALGTKWGYENPLLFEQEETSGKYLMPNCLSLRDALTKEKIPNTNYVFTVPEAQEELRRVGFSGQAFINRLFKPIFSFENMGKTEIKQLSIYIDAKLPNQDWERAFTSNTTINLAGSQKSNVTFNFEYPLVNPLPDQITYRMHFEYLDYKNRKKEKIIGAKWTTNDNYWSYETIK